MAGNFHGFEGPEPRYISTQSWSSNPKCCGSGTYFVYACEVAVFKWTKYPDGRQDVSLYDPKDPQTPFLTIKGILFSTPWIGITLPPTKDWAPGFLRWGLQDITTTINRTSDGKIVKIGNGLNNGNFDTFTVGLCTYTTIEGPGLAKLPGVFFPIGVGTNVPATLYYQNSPYF